MEQPRRRLPSVRRAASGDDGFTLVEILAALAIFAVVSLGLLHSVLAATATSGDARSRLVASNLASEAVAEARAAGRVDLEAVGSATWTRTVEGRTYTIERSATWVTGTSGGSCGASSTTSLLYKRIGVAVRWTNMGSTRPVRADTVVSPPAGVFDPSTGNLALSVVGVNARGVGFAQVTLSGPASRTLTTDAEGCAFFAGVPAGVYTVQVAKTGFVDTRGSSPSSQQVTAVAAATVAQQVDFDEAARIRVVQVASPTGVVVDPAQYPVAAGTKLSLGQSSLPQKRRVLDLSMNTDLAPVYPFTSGYRTWLGTCSDADPEGSSSGSDGPPVVAPVPYWSGTVTAPSTSVQPGNRTDIAVRGAQVEVRLTALGIPVPGATITASHAPEGGIGCNSTETVVLGVTDTDGRVRATMPYGRDWTFRHGAVVLTTATLDPADTYPQQVFP